MAETTARKTYEPTDLELVYICNIEPREFRHNVIGRAAWTEDYEKRTGNHWRRRGRTEYILPAADPKTQFSILKVYSAIDVYHNPRNAATTDEKDYSHEMKQAVIPASDIALSLVRIWSAASPGLSSQRGIMIIGDSVPTAAERSTLERNFRLYCEQRVNQAQDFAAQGQRSLISAEHMAAARHIGAIHDWVTQDDSNKRCPACHGVIRSNAQRCSHCSVDLADFYLNVEFYTPEDLLKVDKAVGEAVIARMERQKKQAQARPAVAKA